VSEEINIVIGGPANPTDLRRVARAPGPRPLVLMRSRDVAVTTDPRPTPPAYPPTRPN